MPSVCSAKNFGTFQLPTPLAGTLPPPPPAGPAPPPPPGSGPAPPSSDTVPPPPVGAVPPPPLGPMPSPPTGSPPCAPSVATAAPDKETIELLLAGYTEFSQQARKMVLSLSLQHAMRVLAEYEQRKPSIRNPSGFVARTAQRLQGKDTPAGESEESCAPPPRAPEWTPQEELEISAWALRHGLDDTVTPLLRLLPHKSAARILSDLESKGATVRNPSAYCSAAAKKARQREEGKRKGKNGEAGDAAGVEEVADVVNHYEALEVEDTADEVTIKKAYRKLVLKWHPDKHPADRDEAEEKIRALNEAYEVLSNPTKKQAYDQQRKAVEMRRQGTVLRSTLNVKTDLPRECMLQPVGYPDKFVRYAQFGMHGRGGPQCFVQSRAEARRAGNDITLEEFMPFFEATKLSFWWLPEVNSMCRIRAMEMASRGGKGETVKAGQAGGLNLAFRIDQGESPTDSSVKLMEARRGEKKEMVNFVVLPSPHYHGAVRFEAAYHQGYYISFRPPTGLRIVPHVEGSGSNVVIDFHLVDFAHMFKFIELEEVLRPAMASVTNWMPLDMLKADANVQAYFGSILGVPIWDDDDFQSYFSGHFDTWEWNAELRSVRMRTREERLSLELQSASTSDQMAQKLAGAASEVLAKLPWPSARNAFQVLCKGGSEKVSSVLARMEAKQKLIDVLTSILNAASADSDAGMVPLSALVEFASLAHSSLGDTGVVKTREDVRDYLVSQVMTQIEALNRAKLQLDLPLPAFASLLALPGMSEKSDVLLLLIAQRLAAGELPELLKVAEAATAAGAASVAKAVVASVFVPSETAPMEERCKVLKTVLKTGLLEPECTAALPVCADAMDLDDLASCVAFLAGKGVASKELATASATLASRAPLADHVSRETLLNVAVGGTKTHSVACALGKVAEAAAVKLSRFPVADVIRLLLAISKAKGPVPESSKSELLVEAASFLTPKLPELPTMDVIKIGLAVGGASDHSNLLAAVAEEAGKRVVSLQPAQLLVLTQALLPLGGRHASMRRVVHHWADVLLGDTGPATDACKRRKPSENVGALTPDQLVKLAVILAPISIELEKETLHRYLLALGTTIAKQFEQLAPKSQEAIEQQVKGTDGLALWRDRDKLLVLFPKGGKVCALPTPATSPSPQRVYQGTTSANEWRDATASATLARGAPAVRAENLDRRSRSRELSRVEGARAETRSRQSQSASSSDGHGCDCRPALATQLAARAKSRASIAARNRAAAAAGEMRSSAVVGHQNETAGRQAHEQAGRARSESSSDSESSQERRRSRRDRDRDRGKKRRRRHGSSSSCDHQHRGRGRSRDRDRGGHDRERGRVGTAGRSRR